MTKKKVIKIKWKNVFLLSVFCFFLILTITETYQGIKWYISSKNTKEQINKLNKTTKIKESNSKDNLEKIKEDIKKSDPYWDYMKMNLIDVDFKNLKTLNTDTVGWLQINGTNVNYPFVQTNNNKYYLTHSFDKSYNKAGWIFLDYRNNIEKIDKNTIIYAHGREDKTMFGTIKNILTNSWLKNPDNYVIKLSTEYENTLWQIFSIYRIPTTSDYLKVKFISDNEFTDFSKLIQKRSNHNFNTTITSNDKIITLSTCYNKKEKLVVHAKLIKRQKNKRY